MDVLIILGRPFFVIHRAFVDVESGYLKFRVNDKEVVFNVCNAIKQPNDLHVISAIDVVDEAMKSVYELTSMDGVSLVVLLNYDEDNIDDYDKVIATLIRIGFFPTTCVKLYIDLKN